MRIILICFLIASTLSAAETKTATGGGGASASITYDEATGVYSFTRTHNSNDYDEEGTGWIYHTTGDGGPYGAKVFDTNHGSPHQISGTLEPGWYRAGVRTMKYENVTGGPVQFYFQVGNGPQTCNLNIFNASMTAGGSVNFTMSGAQAGNKYNVTVLAGQGGVNYDNTTGQGQIISTGTGNGQIDVKAWISAGGGYAKSPDVYGSVQVYPPESVRKITVTIPAGDGLHSVTYIVKQDGVVLGTYEQPAGGQPIIQQLHIPTSGGAVTCETVVNGVVYDGASIVKSADGSGSVTKAHTIVGNPLLLPSGDGAQIVLPNSTSQVITDPSTSITQAASPSAPSSSSDPKKNTAPVVWSSAAGSQTDLVTNTVYREGVGKQVQAIADLQTKLIGSEFKPSVPVERALPETVANYTGEQIDIEVSKLLPVVPSLPSSVGSKSSMEINFGNMGGILRNAIKFDLGFGPGSSSAVSYIRAVELFVLGVFFFFAVVRLIRQTFAG